MPEGGGRAPRSSELLSARFESSDGINSRKQSVNVNASLLSRGAGFTKDECFLFGFPLFFVLYKAISEYLIKILNW